MRCPVCEIELDVIEAAGLHLDQCSQCWGVWFDKGELRPFIDFALANRDIEATGGSESTLAELVEEQADFEIDCPACQTPLDKYVYAGDSGVVLDQCENCGGIWVDKPEVHDLAAYLTEDPEADKLNSARAKLAVSLSGMRDGTDDMSVAADLIKYIASALKTRLNNGASF